MLCLLTAALQKQKTEVDPVSGEFPSLGVNLDADSISEQIASKHSLVTGYRGMSISRHFQFLPRLGK